MKKRILSILTAVLIGLMPMSCFAGTIDLSNAKDSQTLWLVNRNAPIPKDYYAPDMKQVSGTSYLLRGRAADAYQSMYNAMQKAKVGKVYLRSTYRSFGTQTYLFNSRLAQRQKNGMSYSNAYASTARFTAVPGTSEHQTGLAVDVTVGGALSDSFKNTAPGKWLADHSWEYGFILRYTSAKEGFTMIGNEPWHFRYVGAPHAQIMKLRGWCYEEYISQLKAAGRMQLPADTSHLFEVYYFPIADGIPSQITGSAIDSAGASIYCSGDNAGGFIVTVYGPYDKQPVDTPDSTSLPEPTPDPEAGSDSVDQPTDFFS